MSDHSCVIFDLSFCPDPMPLRTRAQRRIINEPCVESFSAMFDPSLLRGHNDADVLIQHFNSQCLSILDKVAPVKSSLVSLKNPWVNETTQNLKRICQKLSAYGNQLNSWFTDSTSRN